MRTFIVGDVHGCREELEALLTKAKVGDSDRLVLVGDLVAKGPDSAGVVRLARKRGALAVKGNHDAHVLKFRRGEADAMKKGHRAVAETLKEADWEFLEALPLWREFPELDAVVVHAGRVPGTKLSQQSEHDFLNMRSIDAAGKATRVLEDGVPWVSKWKGPGLVVFGHDAVRGLQDTPKALGLDTGCVYGRALTGVWLPERVLVSVPAFRVWAPIDAG